MVLITAWWSLHVHVGTHHNNRPLRARPLRDLERVLGHRLHVDGYILDGRAWVEPGLYRFDAHSYIEAETIDAAVVGMLNQLRTVTTRVLQPAVYPLRRNLVCTSADLDEATIGAFYWQPPDQIGLTQFVSSGVLLHLPKRPIDPKRAIVRLPPRIQDRADYEIIYDITIFCSTHAKLMNYHWPKFRDRYFPDGCDLVEVALRTGTGMPNNLKVRRI